MISFVCFVRINVSQEKHKINEVIFLYKKILQKKCSNIPVKEKDLQNCFLCYTKSINLNDHMAFGYQHDRMHR